MVQDEEFYKVKVEIEYFNATYKIMYFISIFDYFYKSDTKHVLLKSIIIG